MVPESGNQYHANVGRLFTAAGGGNDFSNTLWQKSQTGIQRILFWKQVLASTKNHEGIERRAAVNPLFPKYRPSQISKQAYRQLSILFERENCIQASAGCMNFNDFSSCACILNVVFFSCSTFPNGASSRSNSSVLLSDHYCLEKTSIQFSKSSVSFSDM